MHLKNIAAAVTGGASGLGMATARALSEAGAKVAIFDINEDAGESLADELDGVFCRADVTDDASVAAAFDRARERHGQERVLINCAGVFAMTPMLGRHDLAEAERVVRINLLGTLRCIAMAANGMARAAPLSSGERGAIVNVASVAAEDGGAGYSAYAASKAAIVGMTLPLAREFGRQGIRVNTILPGVFATPMNPAMTPRTAQTIPFPQRAGDPAEFAALALEMCRNPYLNGEDVRLDAAVRLC